MFTAGSFIILVILAVAQVLLPEAEAEFPPEGPSSEEV